MQIRIVCELFSLAAIWQMPHADARHSTLSVEKWKGEGLFRGTFRPRARHKCILLLSWLYLCLGFHLNYIAPLEEHFHLENGKWQGERGAGLQIKGHCYSGKIGRREPYSTAATAKSN